MTGGGGGLLYILEYQCRGTDTLTPAYSEASQFGMFVLWLTHRGQISTSWNVETSLLKASPFNVPRGCCCRRDGEDLCMPWFDGRGNHEIIHAFRSLHQYFYLIRSFLLWKAASLAPAVALDSSFNRPSPGEQRITVRLTCGTVSSPLAALVEKCCWIARMKISFQACNIICWDMPSYWVYQTFKQILATKLTWAAAWCFIVVSRKDKFWKSC